MNVGRCECLEGKDQTMSSTCSKNAALSSLTFIHFCILHTIYMCRGTRPTQFCELYQPNVADDLNVDKPIIFTTVQWSSIGDIEFSPVCWARLGWWLTGSSSCSSGAMSWTFNVVQHTLDSVAEFWNLLIRFISTQVQKTTQTRHNELDSYPDTKTTAHYWKIKQKNPIDRNIRLISNQAFFINIYGK